MSTLTTLTRRFLTDEEGASLVEYGLLVVLIALAAITAITLLGTNISTVFTNAANKLVAPATPPG